MIGGIPFTLRLVEGSASAVKFLFHAKPEEP